jgi:creatinine amidohydrolase
MHLAEVTWTDVDDADASLALLPVGSTEQHGPHAPLGTDIITAEAVAGAGADRYEAANDEPVLVAPPVPVGVAEEHRRFAGTLWVPEDSFRAYVGDVLRSLGDAADRVVVVNGHGGNIAALRECCARVTRDGDAYAVPFTWFDVAEGMGHGGPVETALVRHVAPDLVHEDRLEAAADGAADGWGEWVAGVNLAYDSDEFTDNGVVGDPRDGDPARGERLLEEAAGALVELLARLRERDPGDHRRSP